MDTLQAMQRTAGKRSYEIKTYHHHDIKKNHDAHSRESTAFENSSEHLKRPLRPVVMEAQPLVFVLAATNSIQAIDEAFLQPGRFEHLLYVGPPDKKGRQELLVG
jgi:SpoVK/Ycf46/Vps4 family AAA+-type ATPase